MRTQELTIQSDRETGLRLAPAWLLLPVMLLVTAPACGRHFSSAGQVASPARTAAPSVLPTIASGARIVAPSACPSNPSIPNPAAGSAVPAPRFAAGLAYDAKHGYLLLFGGADFNPCSPLPPGWVIPAGYGNAVSNETWTWNGSRWTLLHPPTAPPARTVWEMAYDPASERVILLGGGAANSDPKRNDMWSWDGTTWTELHPTTMPSGWIAPSASALDGDGSTVMLVSFDASGNLGTWQWTGSDWVYKATVGGPQTASKFAFVYDPDRHQDVLAAGWRGYGPQASAGDTWLLRQGTWTRVESASEAPQGEAVGAYDQTRHQLVLVTPANGAPNDWANPTWTWDGNSWTRHRPSHRPPGGLWFQSMAYDPISRQVIMFGGKSDELGPKVINQTWAWNGVDWVQLG